MNLSDTPMEEMGARDLAILIAQQASELKAEGIVVLDVQRTCSFTRFFVLATANSTPHLHALGHRIVRLLRDLGPRPFNVAGFDTTTWVVLDYADVVAHFQSADARDYFRLERLWADAERVDWEAAPVAAALAGQATATS